MIFSYNPKHVGDTLMVILADDHNKENFVESKGNVSRVFTEDGTVAWNLFHISETVALTGNGQVTLTDEELAQVNQLIQAAGFIEQLAADHEPKIVVGYVQSCEKHPDSDHLSVTMTEVAPGEVLQIVCGAPNVAAGQKVVVAKPGAMMPDGLLIWSGELRGVKSDGMICSARELHLPDAPTEKGILVLPEDAVIGTAFQVGK
ncbi:tRNA-binding protein [Enterococcus canis]|uniref:tRNA-binding protein n=1 Tax=Enterococcus canis TaxID=214095 RepID=A0A1L8REH8_9ENTE|nr:DUF4479 and tRNA-binding domain-containing protein [Enterococcus canis]OJG18191.1 tRNA-binding protein [Enterococcus canis]